MKATGHVWNGRAFTPARHTVPPVPVLGARVLMLVTQGQGESDQEAIDFTSSPQNVFSKNFAKKGKMICQLISSFFFFQAVGQRGVVLIKRN
jgi:hypothetical protein